MEIGEMIGEGNCGIVFKGIVRGVNLKKNEKLVNNFFSKFPVAIKIPKIEEGEISTIEEQVLEFKKELKIISNLFNPRIVLFMGAFCSPKNIKLVVELLDGDMQTILLDKNRHLSLYQRVGFLKQVVEG